MAVVLASVAWARVQAWAQDSHDITFGDRAWECAAWATAMVIHSSVSFPRRADAWKTQVDVGVVFAFDEFTCSEW